MCISTLPMRGLLPLVLWHWLVGWVLLSGAIAAEPREFDVQGTWRAWDAKSSLATVEHDEIPGYMAAMTMDFEVEKNEAPMSFQAGDRVAFRLRITDSGASIGHLRRLSAAPSAAVPLPKSADFAELHAGDRFPDGELIDSTGRRLALHDLAGEPFALTFIFTRCPLPNYCPLLSARFHKVCEALQAGDRARPWRLVSVTLDPEFDTPERLQAYAEGYAGTAGDRWIFATGEPDSIRKFAAACGARFSTNGTLIDHVLRTFVVDARGRVQRVFDGNDWAVETLIEELRGAIAGASITGAD